MFLYSLQLLLITICMAMDFYKRKIEFLYAIIPGSILWECYKDIKKYYNSLK